MIAVVMLPLLKRLHGRSSLVWSVARFAYENWRPANVEAAIQLRRTCGACLNAGAGVAQCYASLTLKSWAQWLPDSLPQHSSASRTARLAPQSRAQEAGGATQQDPCVRCALQGRRDAGRPPDRSAYPL
eukprot:169743-Pleurochrysis_carterae.AAC.2